MNPKHQLVSGSVLNRYHETLSLEPYTLDPEKLELSPRSPKPKEPETLNPQNPKPPKSGDLNP